MEQIPTTIIQRSELRLHHFFETLYKLIPNRSPLHLDQMGFAGSSLLRFALEHGLKVVKVHFERGTRFKSIDYVQFSYE